MVESRQINFTQFYIREFFNRVQSGIAQKLSTDEANLVTELIRHLSQQDQVTNAIARVAEEQGSGELSIFLFDIVDRIEDYAPTAAYQSLQETVDDFITGLTLMVEEEDLRSAIQKVNSKFSAESEKITEKPKKVPVRKVKTEKPQKVVEKPEAHREEISFDRFFEIEFNNQLRDKLLNTFDPAPAAEIHKFMEIVSRDPQQEIPQRAPAALTEIFSLLSSLWPGKKKSSYRATELIRNLPGMLEKIIKNLSSLNSEHEFMIRDSLAKRAISIPAEKIIPKFKKEEIPEQPTTIDNLLSEYFQFEVDEHVQQFQKIFAEITANPEEHKNLNLLAGRLQSFKEISMIHGYTAIEDFCTEMIGILNEGMRKKRSLNPESFQVFETFFRSLKSADKLKDVRQKNPELLQLQQLPEMFRESLFTRKRRKDGQPAEPEVAEPVEEIRSEEIRFSDRGAILSLFSDVLQTVRSNLQETLLPASDPGPAEIILNKLIATAQLIQENDTVQILIALKNKISRLPAGGPQNKAAVTEWLDLYDQVAQNLPVQVDWPAIKGKLENFDLQFLATATVIPSSDRDQLIKILLEIEKPHLAEFADSLQKVFMEKDESERTRQLEHFERLAVNLQLLPAPKTRDFTDYYSSLFKPENQFHPDPIIIDEIWQVYKLFLQTLETRGADADTGEMISVLKEIIQPEEAAAEPEPPPSPAEKKTAEEVKLKPAPAQKEKIEKPEEEGEEDLEEIFKQEAEKDLAKAENALANLESGGLDRNQFGAIEKSLHSIKSSARLMGYNDVANLAAPMEAVCEKMQSSAVVADENLLPVLKEILDGLRLAIIKEPVDFSMLKTKLKTIKLEEKSVPATGKSPDTVIGVKKAKAGEKPLFAAAGTEDEDMLQIFREESAEYIRIIEAAIGKLKDDRDNPEALSQLEHASHSLKSAAKMLGFREIGQIGDGLELIAEAIQKNEIANDPDITQNITAAMNVIRKLTTGEKYDPDILGDVLHHLDLQNLKARQAGKSKLKTARETPVERIVLSNETELFLKEAWEIIEKINQDLLKLEKNPTDRALVDNLCRNLHTLKGGAQIMQFENIGKLTHRIEDFFEKVKGSTQTISGDNLDIVFKGVDEIQAMAEAVKAGKEDRSDSYESTLADLNMILGFPGLPPVSTTEKIPRKQTLVSETESDQVSPIDQEQVIKITTERLDKLVNMAAELVVNKSQFLNYLDSLRKIGNVLEQGKQRLKSTSGTLENILEKPDAALDMARTDQKINQIEELTQAYKEFKEMLKQLETVSTDFNLLTRYVEQNISQISSLTKLLHDDILQVRMVPTDMLFSRFPRAVRDQAKKQAKKVNLVVEGADTELDRAMVETLTDPVMHLIRNAIDHGIETPQERVNKGKSEDGIILLKAYREKNQVIIEVQDDGRGMDLVKIRQTIRKKNLAGEQEIARMSETDLMDFVFYPGFSTKEVATDISGRGVGLDVVAAQLRKIKGNIRITSHPDKGTQFRIRVPLTLAIIPAVLVEQNQNVLAIPLTAVEETVQFKPDQVNQQSGKTYLNLRQESIPMVLLSRYLNYAQTATGNPERNLCLIIREAGIKFVLVVDKVLRREDIVVKSLGEPLSRLNYVSGGTILGDGSIALVLDVSAITRKIQAEFYGAEKDFSSIDLARKKILETQQTEKTNRLTGEEQPEKEIEAMPILKKKITGRKPVALIVDDSISVRKFVSSVLERYNYITVLASDGPEAVEKLEKSTFDIVITDLEMPQMHGFELIEKIRKNVKYKNLPIVILTGRAGEESKEKGKRLGANAYIIKPFKETDLLKTLEKFIEV